MLFCFDNISAEILQHILGYSFCAKSHILEHFCQTLLLTRASKIYLGKCCSALVTKIFAILAPGLLFPTGPLSLPS
jgi:hypothetical protein